MGLQMQGNGCWERLNMESDFTSMSETVNINNFRFRVDRIEFDTFDEHVTNMNKFFSESGLLIMHDNFHFHIVDHKKWLLAKIKYGF
jgi:hypothetical protein